MSCVLRLGKIMALLHIKSESPLFFIHSHLHSDRLLTLAEKLLKGSWMRVRINQEKKNHLSIQPVQEEHWQLPFSLTIAIHKALDCTSQFTHSCMQDLSP